MVSQSVRPRDPRREKIAELVELPHRLGKDLRAIFIGDDHDSVPTRLVRRVNPNDRRFEATPAMDKRLLRAYRLGAVRAAYLQLHRLNFRAARSLEEYVRVDGAWKGVMSNLSISRPEAQALVRAAIDTLREILEQPTTLSQTEAKL